MKKILILGCTGMAGHLITLFFQEKNYDVVCLSNTPFVYGKNNVICDVTNQDKLKKIIECDNYDAIINCVGLLNAACDERRDLAIYLNSFLPHFICNLIKNKPTKFIQMSTDCVFSGYTGPYKENSFKDGSTFYDRTKALGEVDDNKNLTFRNSIIGPDMNINGIGLFNWFMKQTEEINGFDGVKWTGVTTLALAKAMEKAINCNLSGIYNLVNNKVISKYEMLCLFKKEFGKNVKINKLQTPVLEKILVNNRQEEFNFMVPSYESMIHEMREWIFEHKSLYSHYFDD